MVTILSRKGLFAIAAVVDVALQKDRQPIAAKTLAVRHGLSPRHLEAVLQALVRGGILKGIRGPHGGYLLARERHAVTANEILRAAGTIDETEEELNSELVAKVVLPFCRPLNKNADERSAGSVWTISLTEQPSTATERRFVTAEEVHHVTHYHRMLRTRPSM